MFFVLNFLKYTYPLFLLFIALRTVSILRLNQKGKHTTIGHELGALVLTTYIAGVLYFTVNIHNIWSGRFIISDTYNLIPFSGIQAVMNVGSATYIQANLFGNILMFAPFGLLLPLLFRKCGLLRTVLLGAAFSALIELTQFFTGRGTDIDDLILNTLGALLGYTLFALLHTLFPKLCNRFRIS